MWSRSLLRSALLLWLAAGASGQFIGPLRPNALPSTAHLRSDHVALRDLLKNVPTGSEINERLVNAETKVIQRIRRAEGVLLEDLQTVKSRQDELARKITSVAESLLERLVRLQAPQRSCPAGWRPAGQPSGSAAHRACLFLPAQSASWYGAQTECARLDRRARLASVHAETAGTVRELVAAAGGPVWLGLVRGAGDRWSWSDGSPDDAAGGRVGWLPGEPDNSGGREHCAAQTPPSDDADGGWDDEDCDSAHRFLCQIHLA